MFLPSTDYKAIFANNVWNVFNALGSKYLVFFCPGFGCYRLIPPSNTNSADFYADDEAIDWLESSGFISIGKGQIPVFNGIERPKWYVLTKEGQAAYDELSTLENFHEKFVQRFRPIQQS